MLFTPEQNMPQNTPHHTTELYSYYHTHHTPNDSQAAVHQEVTAAHTRLGQLIPGLQSRLLQRCENANSAKTTWMEVFSHPQGLSEPQIEQIHMATANLPTQRLGPRVTERFSAGWLDMG
jgi:hypothetical protein